MGTISLNLPQIGQPNSTEDPKITTALTTIQTVINGQLDAANIATSGVGTSEIADLAVTTAKIAANAVGTSQLATANQPATLLGPYRTLIAGTVGLAAGASGALYLTSNATAVAAASNTTSPPILFHFDPADYAVSGLTTKVRVKLSLFTNATAPAANFTASLVPVTAVAGSASLFQIATVGAATATTSTITAPGASSMNNAVSSDVTAPSAGYFALAVTPSTGTAANNLTIVTVAIQMRHV